MNNKPTVPLKTYNEDSTYGKHRANYRANTVYANVPLTATSPTRPDGPPARPDSQPLLGSQSNNNNLTMSQGNKTSALQLHQQSNLSTAADKSKLVIIIMIFTSSSL